MSRLYLYGVTRPREVEERLAEQGIFLIAAEDCAAIVSDLDEGPVEATRRNLLAHADVVEQLHVEAVVLPARFGHVLESGEEAFELLALPEIEQLLERHETTCELTLKGTYEESVLAEVGAELGPLRAAYRAEPSVDAGIALGEAVGELAAFDFALLADRDSVEPIAARLEELAARLSPPLHFKLVGPLPPYSFVHLTSPAVA